MRIQSLLEQRLRARLRTWSQVKYEMGAMPGLRAVEFNANLLREALIDDRAGVRWLEEVSAQLPSDVVVYDLMENEQIIHMKSGVGAPYDILFIVFASKEWPALEEGSQIPCLTIEMKAAAA